MNITITNDKQRNKQTNKTNQVGIVIMCDNALFFTGVFIQLYYDIDFFVLGLNGKD